MNQQPPPYAGGRQDPYPPAGPVTSDESTWAAIAHLAPLIGYFIAVGHILVPLVVLFTRGQTSEFVRDQAKESLNFQITMTIYIIMAVLISLVLMLVLIGFVLIFVLPGLILLYELVLTIQAATAVGRGERYRYPGTLRLIP